jgi:hypothetical protein
VFELFSAYFMSQYADVLDPPSGIGSFACQQGEPDGAQKMVSSMQANALAFGCEL